MSKGKRIEDYRDNPLAIARYLTEILEKNDLDMLLVAINTVMRAQNVLQLSKSMNVRRRALYKAFGGGVDPRFGMVLRLFAALGLRLSAKPLPVKKRPPRPKLGRPPSRPSRRP